MQEFYLSSSFVQQSFGGTNNMGKQMTYWLFIGMFQGLVSETKAFRKIEDAEKAFLNYTKLNWDKVNLYEKTYTELTYGDYAGSQIQELQIEA